MSARAGGGSSRDPFTLTCVDRVMLEDGDDTFFDLEIAADPASSPSKAREAYASDSSVLERIGAGSANLGCARALRFVLDDEIAEQAYSGESYSEVLTSDVIARPVLIKEADLVWHLVFATVRKDAKYEEYEQDADGNVIFLLTRPIRTWAYGPRDVVSPLLVPPGVNECTVAWPDYPFWLAVTEDDWNAWANEAFGADPDREDADLVDLLDYAWRGRLNDLRELARRARSIARKELLEAPSAHASAEDKRTRAADGAHGEAGQEGGWRAKLSRFDDDHTNDTSRSSLDGWRGLLVVSEVADELGNTDLGLAPRGGIFPVDLEIEQEVRSDLARVADETRTAIAQLAQTASFISIRNEGERAERESSFQRILAFIAALVLAPGLLVSLYGANVALPSQGEPEGTALLIAGMFAAGLLTAWWLRWRDGTRSGTTAKSRDQLPFLAGGILACLVVIALIALAAFSPVTPSTQGDWDARAPDRGAAGQSEPSP